MSAAIRIAMPAEMSGWAATALRRRPLVAWGVIEVLSAS
jgi:hypothetical protein